MGTRSKTQQQAISRTAASCVKSHVNKSTESDEPSSSAHSGQPVTIEQFSSLFQTMFQSFRAAFKAELQAELQAELLALILCNNP